MQMMTMDAWMSTVTRPIGKLYPGAFFFFIFFVGLASLGMLNLLTAIFVESLSRLTAEGALAQEQKKKVPLSCPYYLFSDKSYPTPSCTSSMHCITHYC